MSFLDGKKSYILALAAIILAGVGIWQGKLGYGDALELIGLGLGVATLRRGMTTETVKTVAAIQPGASVPSASEAKSITPKS